MILGLKTKKELLFENVTGYVSQNMEAELSKSLGTLRDPDTNIDMYSNIKNEDIMFHVEESAYEIVNPSPYRLYSNTFFRIACSVGGFRSKQQESILKNVSAGGEFSRVLENKIRTTVGLDPK